MADTVSALLQILLMADGSNENTWGDNTNANLQKLEAAICGSSTVDLSSVSSGAYTLTDDQARPFFLTFSGSPSTGVTVTIPDRTKRWSVANTTGQILTLVTAGGASYSVPPGTVGVNVTRGVDGTLGSGAVLGVAEDYFGVELPSSNYLWANGATVSRAGYANLLAAITKSTTASGSSGSPTLTAPIDLTSRGLIGAKIEGTAIPSGSVISNLVYGGGSTTITLSMNLTGSTTNAPIQIFPYGNGDGSTTFTLPDARQSVAVARGDMGGAADPAKITTFSVTGPKTPNSLAAIGGVEKVSLTSAQNGPHNHALTDPGHNHALTDPGHTHTARGTPFAAGSGSFSGVNNGTQTTSKDTTGITIAPTTTGITIQQSGTGDSHANMPPFYVCNKIIRVN